MKLFARELRCGARLVFGNQPGDVLVHSQSIPYTLYRGMGKGDFITI
jgi:hypothetical protein